VAAGLPAVMTGHIAVRAVDRGVPASISHKVTTGLLRHRLGFDGLVVTDALNMGGVQGAAPGGRAAVRALHAGADVLLMPPDPKAARERIVHAVRSGALDRARLEEAAARMIDTLRSLRGRPSGKVDASRTARALSRAALTSVAGPCSGRLVADRVRVVGPSSDVATFDRLLSARGVTIAHDRVKRVRAGTRRVVAGHRKRWVRERYREHGHWKTRRVRKRVPVYKKVPVYKHVTVPADAPTVALAGPGSEVSGPVDVLVALDRPGVLGRVGARVKLATYGDTATTLSVLVDVLLGKRQAPGRLPIDVPGVGREGCGS
jgi:beta-N-acetylhexosaminidase